MLVVELGVWVIPCRRIVLLVTRLQEMYQNMMVPRLVVTSREEDRWSRLARVNSMAFMM
jgi:hypothetical protein